MRRELNRRFLVLLITAGLLGSAGLYVLYGVQVKRHTDFFLVQADRAEKQGNLGQAAAYLSRYLTLAPGDTEALARYGVLLDRSATSSAARLSALLVLDQVLRRQPQRADLRRRCARLALESGQVAGARKHLEVLRQAQPNDGELERLQAACEEADGRWARAASWLEKSIKHAPTCLESYAKLAVLVRGQLADRERGDKVMDALIAANSGSYQAYLARARYGKDFRSPAETAKDLARARALAPDNGDVLLASAAAARARGDLAEARTYLGRLLGLRPRQAALYTALASVEHLAGRDADAMAHLRQGLKTVPQQQQPPLARELAELLIRGGRLAEAKTVIGGLGPLPPAVLDYYKARILFQQEQWGKAVSILQRLRPAAAPLPDLAVKVNLLLGLCYEQLADPDQQREAYRRAVTLEPSSGPARLGLGSALLSAGRLEPALTQFWLLVALPEVPTDGWLLLARALILHNLRSPAGQRDWSKVEEILSRARQATPDAPDIPILHAQALVAQGQFSHAWDLLEKARDRQPRQVRYWVALADTAERRARFEVPLLGGGAAVGLMGSPPGAVFAVLNLSRKPGKAAAAAAAAVLDEAERRLGNGLELRLARLRHPGRRFGAGGRKLLGELEQGLARSTGAERLQLLRQLAEEYARAGAARDAERLWAQLAERRPEDFGIRLLLFDLALQAGQDDALRRLVGELRRIEGEEGVWWRYGEAARLVERARRGDRGALGQARARLAEVAGWRPRWARVPLLRAEIEDLEGHEERALEHYQEALAMEDCQPAVAERVVKWLYARGRYAAADKALRRLQEQTALSADLGRLGAQMAVYVQDAPRALALARQAVADEPDNYRNHLALGLSLWAAGQRAEAEVSLRRALALNDGVPETLVALVHFLAGTGQADRAEDVLRRARRKLPPPEAAPVLAHCYDTIGRPDQAEPYYRATLAAGPARPVLLRQVADFYLRQDAFPKAEPHLRRLLDPQTAASADDTRWARLNLAIGLAQAGGYPRFQEALALLDRDRMPGAAAAVDQRVRAVVLASQPARRREAIGLFEDLLKKAALAPQDQVVLVRLYEADRDWPKARPLLLRLLRSPQGKSPLFLAYGVGALLGHGETAAAEAYLAQLEYLAPEAAQTLVVKALVLKARGQGGEAAALLEAYAKQANAVVGVAAAALEELGEAKAAEALYRKQASQSGRPEGFLALAACLGRQGRLQEALDLCARAGQTGPPESVAAASLALLRTAGRARPEYCARVGRWLEAAAARQPEAAPLLLGLAELRDLQGRHPEAAALYRRVVERDGHNAVALNNLAWLMALQDGQATAALGLINRAIDAHGPLGQLLDTRAVIYLHAGREDLARKDLEEAIAQAPTPARYFHLAQACWAAHDRVHAGEALGRAEAAGLTADRLHPLERAAYRTLLRALGRP